MRLNENEITVDGKSFPNEYKANEYIQKKVGPLEDQLKKCKEQQKEIEKQLEHYYKVGDEIEKTLERDVQGSRIRRKAVGKDVDSETGMEWKERVRKHLYEK